jgi:hypothetical protein
MSIDQHISTICKSDGKAKEPCPLTLHKSCLLAKLKWTELVTSVQAADSDGLMKLHATFARGLRFILRKTKRCGVEENILDVLRIVTVEIRKGRLTKPEDLPYLVLKVARRSRDVSRAASSKTKIPGITSEDQEFDEETRRIIEQKSQLALKALALLSPRQREIITRSYFRAEGHEEIYAAMKITQAEVQKCKTTFRISLAGDDRKPAQIGHAGTAKPR